MGLVAVRRGRPAVALPIFPADFDDGAWELLFSYSGDELRYFFDLAYSVAWRGCGTFVRPNSDVATVWTDVRPSESRVRGLP